MIEIEALTKRFPGTTALSNVDLTIRQGETVALAGENGAGKSTLLQVLAGHVYPDAGDLHSMPRRTATPPPGPRPTRKGNAVNTHATTCEMLASYLTPTKACVLKGRHEAVWAAMEDDSYEQRLVGEDLY